MEKFNLVIKIKKNTKYKIVFHGCNTIFSLNQQWHRDLEEVEANTINMIRLHREQLHMQGVGQGQ